MLLSVLKKLFIKSTHGMGMVYANSAENDYEYLYSFPEPKSDIERSYFQYKCQIKNDQQPIKYCLSNIAAAILILPYICFFLRNNKYSDYVGEQRTPMMIDFISKGFMPDALLSDSIPFVLAEDNLGSLSNNDLQWLSNISIVKYGPFFFFKTMCRVAVYSRLINMYHPEKICSSAEYSFTSSILTAYCSFRGIEHVNISHGEKFFELTSAFARFDKFYIWDDYYIKIYQLLRADKTEYIVYKRRSFDLDPCHTDRITYYLQIETLEQLIMIRNLLDSMGVDYRVRLHPIYSNELCYKVFDSDRIEIPSEVSLRESLNQTKYVVSRCSEVLYEAFISGRTIVIDDVTDPELYEQLLSRKYIMMQKPHLLLSEMQVCMPQQ